MCTTRYTMRRTRAIASTAVAAATLAAAVGSTSTASAAQEPPLPASGHAQVVAQQVVELTAGAHHWSLRAGVVQPDAAVTLSGGPIGFVIAADGTVLAVGVDGGPFARLGIGEAIPISAERDVTLVSGPDRAFSYLAVVLESGDSPGAPADVGGSFTLGSGWRDLNLVRDVLAPGETSSLAHAGEAPTLLVATDGELIVTADDSVILQEGDVLLIGGDVQLSSSDFGPASYIATVIGAVIDPAMLPTPATTTPTVPPTTVPPTTVPSLVEAAPPAACDGYRDNDRYPIRRCDKGEAVRLIQLGLQNAGYAVDIDGFFGHQTEQAVRAFQAAHGLEVDGLVGAATWPRLVPLAPGSDTDGNGFVDPYELGSSPAESTPPDSDGDGLSDELEAELGTDPHNIDTDGDGVFDGAEIEFGLDPLNPDTDGDGVSDLHDEYCHELGTC